MPDLIFELKQLCRRNHNSIYATQRDRECVLDLMAQAKFRNSATGTSLQQASSPSTSRACGNDCRLRV